MSKTNIYDVVISELILRSENSDASNLNFANLIITSNISQNTVPQNFNRSDLEFKSTLENLPNGFSIVPNSHVMSYPDSTADTVGSDVTINISNKTVILGSVGSVYTVSSVIQITDGIDTITIEAEYNINAVLPIYYGVKPAPVGNPNTSGLFEISSDNRFFKLDTTSIGRLFVIVPSGLGQLFKGVHDANGFFIPTSSFTTYTDGTYYYYYTSYDTQFTGNYTKTFLMVFSSTGTLNDENTNIINS